MLTIAAHGSLLIGLVEIPSDTCRKTLSHTPEGNRDPLLDPSHKGAICLVRGSPSLVAHGTALLLSVTIRV